MTDIKIGGLYEDKGNYRFKVLCVDGDACFIKWLDEDNNHGVLSVEAILERCKPFEPQTNADQHVQHVESVEPTWSKENHEAFYTFLWNVINPNEMQDYIGMFETKTEPQTERSE